MTGYARQDDHQAPTDGAAVWPGELDEQLISELLSDDSILGALQVPGGDSGHNNCCSGDDDTRADHAADPAPCNSGGAAECELPQPEAVSRALCSVYSGPTIQDIEKALSSRPCHWSGPRYSPSMYFGRFGASSRGPAENKYTTNVRSSDGKMPSDGFKWRKYGQKVIKNNPYPRSYYKCTNSRCGAKKQVEKCVDYPEMFIVTYEGPHLHAPQHPRHHQHWPSANRQRACGDGAGGGGAVVASDLLRLGRRHDGPRAEHGVTVPATRSCDDDGSSASVAAPRDDMRRAASPCDSPQATTCRSCPDVYCSSSWSPEALLP